MRPVDKYWMAVAIFACFVGGLFGFGTARSIAPTQTVVVTPGTKLQPPGGTYANLSKPYAGEKLFLHTCGVRDVVNSAYLYEANLLDYSTPVADTDYLVANGATCETTLPGLSTDRYYYQGSVFVQGSGWVIKILTPNGGHAAFLHMSVVYLSTVGMPRIYPHTLTTTKPPGVTLKAESVEGDENTARAIGDVSTLPATAPTAGGLPGNTVIGRSGWPSSYEFSNGSCYDYITCEADSHLCWLTDAKAALWFENILTGKHKKPKPKPKLTAKQAKVYEEYRHEHHKSPIAYKDNHGNLLPVVLRWKTLKLSRIGGILHAGVWHPAHERQLNYMRWSYQGGALDYYPTTRNTRVSYWKRWTK